MGAFSRRRGGIAAKIFFLLVLLLLVLGGVASIVYQSAGLRARFFERKLESMPNADYTLLVAGLYADERYDEAVRLAAFVAAHPDMPGQEKIADLREKTYVAIRQKRSPLARGMAFMGGILSRGHGTEDGTGGLIENILAGTGVMPEGDSSKRTKGDSDKLAKALDGAHLGIAGKWFPGAMRTLRRSGLISPEYERFLLANARESAEKGEATPELQSAVASTQTLVTELGLPLALAEHKEVRNDEDLEQLAMWSRLSPDETYVVATQGGVSLLPLLPDTAAGRSMLAKIAKKGERAIRSARFWLR